MRLAELTSDLPSSILVTTERYGYRVGCFADRDCLLLVVSRRSLALERIPRLCTYLSMLSAKLGTRTRGEMSQIALTMQDIQTPASSKDYSSYSGVIMHSALFPNPPGSSSNASGARSRKLSSLVSGAFGTVRWLGWTYGYLRKSDSRLASTCSTAVRFVECNGSLVVDEVLGRSRSTSIPRYTIYPFVWHCLRSHSHLSH